MAAKYFDIELDENNNDSSKPTDANILQLNVDCLSNICTYLNCNDLIKLSKIHAIFYETISTRIFNTKQLVTSEIKENHSIRKVLKKFGPFLSNLNMLPEDIQYKSEYLSNTDEMLMLIRNHCLPEKLKTIVLGIEFEVTNDSTFESLALNFSHINDVSIYAVFKHYKYLKARGSNHDIHIQNLLKNAIELKKLRLTDVKISGLFLKQIPLTNLSELQLENCRYLDYSLLADVCEEMGETIKIFTFINSRFDGYQDIGTIIYCVCRIMGKFLPNLQEGTVTMNFGINYCGTKLGQSSSVYDNLLNLSKLRKLTLGCAGACGCFYLSGFIQKLSLRNTLEYLSIESPLHWCYTSCVPSSKILDENLPLALADLTNLRFLRLVDVCRHEDRLLQVLANNLINLTDFFLTGYRKIYHQKFIDFCVQMKQLKRIHILNSKLNFNANLYLRLKCALCKRPNLPFEIYVEQSVRNRLLNEIPLGCYEPNVIKISY